MTGPTLTALYADLLDHGGVKGRCLSPTTVRLVHRVLNWALQRRGRGSRPGHEPGPVREGARAAPCGDAHVERRAGCGVPSGDRGGTVSVVSQRTTDADWNVVTKAQGHEPTRHRSRRRRCRRPAQTPEAVVQGASTLGVGVHRQRARFRPGGRLPYHPARLSDLSQRSARQAGLPPIRLHDARHSCATPALAAGIHPKVVQQLLGHASWSTTMDLYTHCVERLQRDASERIEAALFSPNSGAPLSDELTPSNTLRSVTALSSRGRRGA